MQLAASDLSRSDLCTGTPYYVCPEQIDNRDPDGRGDLYSLGIVLYEMLVGALPYVGNNLAEIFAAIVRPRCRGCRSASCATSPIIDRLLAKDPADRYPSAALFLEDLARGQRADSHIGQRSPIISECLVHEVSFSQGPASRC